MGFQAPGSLVLARLCSEVAMQSRNAVGRPLIKRLISAKNRLSQDASLGTESEFLEQEAVQKLTLLRVFLKYLYSQNSGFRVERIPCVYFVEDAPRVQQHVPDVVHIPSTKRTEEIT